jgi:hypothetical protein
VRHVHGWELSNLVAALAFWCGLVLLKSFEMCANADWGSACMQRLHNGDGVLQASMNIAAAAVLQFAALAHCTAALLTAFGTSTCVTAGCCLDAAC